MAQSQTAAVDPQGETRDRILMAAFLSIAELGIPRASLRVIAKRAGVTTGAVQDHFGTKDNLIVETLMCGLHSHEPDTADDTITRCVSDDTKTRRAFALAVSVEAPHNPVLRAAIPMFMARRFAKTKRAWTLDADVRDDVDLDELAQFLTVLFSGYALTEAQGMPVPSEERLLAFMRTLLAKP